MLKYFTLFISCLILAGSQAQTINTSGTVQDTALKTKIANAVVMAIRLKDSVMIANTRTDANGNFKLNNLPLDTFQILITHPHYGDKATIILGNKENTQLNFGKMAMPPKTLSLKEVTIYATKDPIYYNGDTLVFVADSFKVKPNAVVEDLLKKLPGMKVDAKGAITNQGKKIDQVLVDGDEFFGTDPTVATKNLAANSVESVQVYEKKNESAGSSENETLQVLNLKLKEDAKKGYFGKITGAGDFDRFYEGEFLANKFKGKQKISVFSLGSNTPRSALDFGDAYKYGLNDELNMGTTDDGGMYFYNYNSSPTGIPMTVKSGVYYSDQVLKKTKVNLNYSFNTQQVKSKTITASQYFLTDTTYKTNSTSTNNQRNDIHALNLGITQNLDSLTDMEVTSKLKFTENTQSSTDLTEFITENDSLSRTTDINNERSGKAYDWMNMARITRKFMKKDRRLQLTYNLNLSQNNSSGILKSFNSFLFSQPIDFLTDSINQNKTSNSKNQSHTFGAIYTEPLSLKIKLQFSYDINHSWGNQNKVTSDFANGGYTVENPLFSNYFENTRTINRVGTTFIYEVKKQRFTLGAYGRQFLASNRNIVANTTLDQKVNAFLPYLTYRYSFENNESIRFEYRTSAREPSVNQLQPVPDNTSPNFIRIGNPDLLPSYSNRFNLTYNIYKPISGRYFYVSANYNLDRDDFSDSTVYTSIGQTLTKTVNVQGNYSAGLYSSGSFPFFSKLLEVSPSINYSLNNNNSYINDQKNKTLTQTLGIGLNIGLNFEKLELEFGTDFNYSKPNSTISSQDNQPYTSQVNRGELNWELPKKFRFTSTASHNTFDRRAEGFNTGFIIWNASLSKTLLKNENLILSVDAVDLLNQNISNERQVMDNVITDTRTTIIGRYVLLKAVYKFNSNNEKEDEDDF